MILIIGTFVMTELFTAVILENFSNRGSGLRGFYLDKIEHWSNTWSSVDTECSKMIPVSVFIQKVLMEELPPFGFKGDDPTLKKLTCITAIDVGVAMGEHKQKYAGKVIKVYEWYASSLVQRWWRKQVERKKKVQRHICRWFSVSLIQIMWHLYKYKLPQARLFYLQQINLLKQ